MTEDNSLLAAWAISAVNEAEQMSTFLPRNAEGENMIIYCFNDYRIQKTAGL